MPYLVGVIIAVVYVFVGRACLKDCDEAERRERVREEVDAYYDARRRTTT
jgi:hypothetical protein